MKHLIAGLSTHPHWEWVSCLDTLSHKISHITNLVSPFKHRKCPASHMFVCKSVPELRLKCWLIRLFHFGLKKSLHFIFFLFAIRTKKKKITNKNKIKIHDKNPRKIDSHIDFNRNYYVKTKFCSNKRKIWLLSILFYLYLYY